MLERTNQVSFFPTGTIINYIIKERNKNQSGEEREWFMAGKRTQSAVKQQWGLVAGQGPAVHPAPLHYFMRATQRCQQPVPLRGKGPSLLWVFLVPRMLLLTTSLPDPGWARAGTQLCWGLCICLAECSCSKPWENKSFPLQTGNKLAEIYPTKHHGLSNYVMCSWVYFIVIYFAVCTLSKKLSAACSKYKRRVVYSC